MLRVSSQRQKKNKSPPTTSSLKSSTTVTKIAKLRKSSQRTISTAKLSPTTQPGIKSQQSASLSTTTLDTKTLKHLTIAQYDQKRVQNIIPYDSNIIVQGWVRSMRNQGKVSFLTLNDGSNVTGVQATIDPSCTSQAVLDVLSNFSIPIGSAVRVHGSMVRNERKAHEAPDGWEVRVHDLDIEGICDTTGFLPKMPEKISELIAEEEMDESQSKSQKKKDKKAKKALEEAEKLAQEQQETLNAHRASGLPEIEQYSLAPYPLQKKIQTLEFLRQHPDTRIRTNTYAAVQRVRSHSMVAFHNHFMTEDFVCVQPPIITPSDCEGGGEMFQLERTDKIGRLPTISDDIEHREQKKSFSKDDYFFHRPAFLSVSGQLYAEIAASSIRRVYSFGPTFRAENSHTSRHLAEFWMLEPEMAFATLNELCDACESSIQGTIKALLTNSTTKQDLQFFQQRYDNTLIDRLQAVTTTPFGRITYTDAIDLLKTDIKAGKITFKYQDLKWGDDLGTEHEKYLAEQVFQRPVFVTNYPAKIKPFYMKVDDGSLLSTLPGVSDHNKDSIVTPRSNSISTDLSTWFNYSTKAVSQAQELGNNAPLFSLPTLNNTANAHEDDVTKMTVSCFDLLVPGMGELCGGSQREERLEVLLKRINQYGLNQKEYQWYLDLRRFGTTQHGGWGMGFERFVAYVTGMENVRDTSLVPRAPGLMQI